MTSTIERLTTPRETAAGQHCMAPGDTDGAEPMPGRVLVLTAEVDTPPKRDNRQFWLLVAFLGLLSVVFLGWMVVRPGGDRASNVLDNLAQLLAGLFAMTMCAVAARRHGQRWTGWGLLTASLFATECGNGIWCYYDIVRRQLDSVSLAGDISTALAVPLAVAALLTFPRTTGNKSSRVRGLLDSVLIGAAVFFISWTLVLSPAYEHVSGGVVAEIFNLAYPSADIVIASLVIILVTRAGSRYRVSLGLVSAGLLSFAVADSSFSYLMTVNRYGFGSVTDTGWVLGYFLIALGSLWACNHPLLPGGGSGRPTVWTLMGPNLPLVGVAFAAGWHVYTHHSLDRVSQITFVAVILTMAARQFLVLLDHLALSRELEVKVEQRTADLHHQAFHDGLTGLANRAMFNEYLDDAIKGRAGSCSGLAVLLIDLNNFKRVNDLQGHPMGDELLRLVAKRLQGSLRGVDAIARVGGDEFAVLLQGFGLQLEPDPVAGG